MCYDMAMRRSSALSGVWVPAVRYADGGEDVCDDGGFGGELGDLSRFAGRQHNQVRTRLNFMCRKSEALEVIVS